MLTFCYLLYYSENKVYFLIFIMKTYVVELFFVLLYRFNSLAELANRGRRCERYSVFSSLYFRVP